MKPDEVFRVPRVSSGSYRSSVSGETKDSNGSDVRGLCNDKVDAWSEDHILWVPDSRLERMCDSQSVPLGTD